MKDIFLKIIVVLILLFIVAVGIYILQPRDTDNHIYLQSTKDFAYIANDKLFNLTTVDFYVAGRFTTDELKSRLEGCGTTKSQADIEALLSPYASQDQGTEYRFNYNGQTQAPGYWKISVIPNKLGYTSQADFEKDFGICGAGGDDYPFKVSPRSLFFISSCGSGFDDSSGLPHGCDEIQQAVEPTIQIE